MKTNNKRRAFAALTAGLLALTPVVTAGMTAFAGEGDVKITVTDTDKAQHTYKAYQIFTGTVDGSKLDDLKFGSGVTAKIIIDALEAADVDAETHKLNESSGVDAVAAAINKYINETNIQKFAKAIATTGLTATTLDKGTSGDDYTADVAPGWYLIVDETETLESGDVEGGVRVRSANMLQVTKSEKINAKHSVPSLEKKIKDGEADGKANTAAIGDTVEYEITIKVPDVRGYDKYYYVVEDTLSAGLTYTTGSLSIDGYTLDIDGPESDEHTGNYYVDVTGSTNIKVVFENAVELFKNATPGTDIVIKYSATLNENAVIGDLGNPNTAKLVYSNDPNHSWGGENTPPPGDEPGDGAPTGETPESTVRTYTTAVEIDKVDQDHKFLPGAKFKIVGKNLNEVRLVEGSAFVADEAGEYYKLTNGTYTKEAPAESGDGKDSRYALTDKGEYARFNKNTFSKKEKQSETEDTGKDGDSTFSIEGTVGEDGILRFEGLKPGTYYIYETKAPDGGYNAMTGYYEITITGSIDETSGDITWTSNPPLDKNDDAFVIEIINRIGSQLPETGGIGTKLFYIVGGMLAAGSVVVLVTRKRMSKES